MAGYLTTTIAKIPVSAVIISQLSCCDLLLAGPPSSVISCVLFNIWPHICVDPSQVSSYHNNANYSTSAHLLGLEAPNCCPVVKDFSYQSLGDKAAPAYFNVPHTPMSLNYWLPCAVFP